MRLAILTTALALALAACGGSGKHESSTPDDGDDGASAGDGASDVLIPEEKYEEIRSVFERKVAMVSRCYVVGVETGDLDKAAKGFVTVGVTVTTGGMASNVKILKGSLESPALKKCVVDLVSTWQFTDSLPKPLETSHTYVLDRF